MQNVMVRIDPEKIEAARKKAAEMTAEMGVKVTVSDVVRIALGRFLNGTPVK